MNDINKCFEILGLKPEASLEEVKEAYRGLVKVWHPDRIANNLGLLAEAAEKLNEIDEAYQKIQDFLINLQSHQQAPQSRRDEHSKPDNSTKGEDKQETSQPEDERQPYSASQEPPADRTARTGTNAADLGREPGRWGDNVEKEIESKLPSNFNRPAQSSRSGRYWAIRMAVVIPVACLVGLLVAFIASNIFKESNNQQQSQIVNPYDQKQPHMVNPYKPKESVTAEELKDAESWLAEGDNNFKMGRYDVALNAFNKSIELNPNTASAYAKRGFINVAVRNYSQAIKDCDRSIELNPKYPVAYSARGLAYAFLGNLSQAVKDSDKAVELNPKDSGTYANRGIIYGMTEKYSQAIKDYDRAIELNPKNVAAYEWRATAYDRLGNQSQAIEDWKVAAQLGSKSAQEALSKRNIRW